jgi:signal transduction histidine kinase
VNEALGAPLEEVRVEVGADIVIVVQAEARDPSLGLVLAFSAEDDVCRFLPNEPVHLHSTLRGEIKAISEFGLRSAIRPYQLSCGSSLVIPWNSRGANGWLIIANLGWPEPVHVNRKLARRYSRELRQIYTDAGLRNTYRVQLDLARATRALAEVDSGPRPFEELLTNILSVGRVLLKTSACYLSTPHDGSNIFTFVECLGVRTNSFKHLRMGEGQGLGGRVRDERRAVRSLNYAEDFREGNAPVQETLREGFHSAMCAPLIADGRILGLFYAANRNLTPFTEADGDVLEELTGNVSIMLERAQWDRIRQTAARRNERDRLAHNLHDSVLRNLMEIGYASQLGRDAADLSGARQHFGAIETAAEYCLKAIRRQIGTLKSDWEAHYQPTADEIVDLLKATSCAKNLVHSFRIGAGTGRETLPSKIASALVRIGQEAVRNAELHSHGLQATLELVVEKHAVRLIVEDDGHGIDLNSLPGLLASREHLGLRQMRAMAEEVGGRCALTLAQSGGVRVEVVVPRE